LVGDDPWRRLFGGGRLEAAVLGGGGARVLREERGSAVAVQGEVGSRAGLFIGAGRRFGEEKSSQRPGGRLGRGAMTGLEWRCDELLVQAR
jgi:hypothetical protein